MSNYQMCSLCVMDTSDPDITFNSDGVCSHCEDALAKINEFRYSEEQVSKNLDAIREQIKSRSTGDYDCLIGLSGGVDSSYVAYLAVKKLGLKPLAFHMDNGWNSEIAVANINNVVEKLGMDLETYVIDWEEFRALQRSFIRASVIDVELLSDQAHHAVARKLSKQYKLKTAISGGNFITEHGMPKNWFWSLKQDVKNIRSIHGKYENTPLRTYPQLNFYRYMLDRKFKTGMKSVHILNSINFDKEEAIEVLKKELDWKSYGEKHQESTWTKFYQGYYLPKKFGIDKRRVHLSADIRSKAISRNEALQVLEKPAIKEEDSAEFVDYVIKKLGFTKEAFEQSLREPMVAHDYFETNRKDMGMMARLNSRLTKK